MADPPENSSQAAGPKGVLPVLERDEFFRLLDSLPDSQREVIFLLKVSGMSLEEAARATSSTVGAIKQKAHRAYKKLRLKLKPEKERR